LETITTSEARAQRDNDLIYHKDVPPPSAVSTIQETKLVSLTVPKELLNPNNILQNQRPLFFDLISWGAREAISRYIGAFGILYSRLQISIMTVRKHFSTRKLVVLHENYKMRRISKSENYFVSKHREHLSSALRKLNLPSSLEALERPVGLPPSLLQKAEAVRLEEGPAKIQASVEDVERLARRDVAILEEVSRSFQGVVRCT
jgi:programmed cell death 6-interacting protein